MEKTKVVFNSLLLPVVLKDNMWAKEFSNVMIMYGNEDLKKIRKEYLKCMINQEAKNYLPSNFCDESEENQEVISAAVELAVKNEKQDSIQETFDNLMKIVNNTAALQNKIEQDYKGIDEFQTKFQNTIDYVRSFEVFDLNLKSQKQSFWGYLKRRFSSDVVISYKDVDLLLGEIKNIDFNNVAIGELLGKIRNCIVKISEFCDGEKFEELKDKLCDICIYRFALIKALEIEEKNDARNNKKSILKGDNSRLSKTLDVTKSQAEIIAAAEEQTVIPEKRKGPSVEPLPMPW